MIVGKVFLIIFLCLLSSTVLLVNKDLQYSPSSRPTPHLRYGQVEARGQRCLWYRRLVNNRQEVAYLGDRFAISDVAAGVASVPAHNHAGFFFDWRPWRRPVSYIIGYGGSGQRRTGGSAAICDRLSVLPNNCSLRGAGIDEPRD